MSDELARRIAAACYLEGEFRLRSGETSHEYFDKYRFESAPALLHEIAQRALPLLPAGTEVLAGIELGGIPLVTALSLFSGLPAAFVRKQAKAYGTCRLAEGTELAGRRTLLVEDVVTSAGQILACAKALRELGARIDAALCVVDREEGGCENLAAQGIALIPLFRRRELLAARHPSTPGPDPRQLPAIR
jgi:orotate phosphoribosyltransferase